VPTNRARRRKPAVMRASRGTTNAGSNLGHGAHASRLGPSGGVNARRPRRHRASTVGGIDDNVDVLA
jgi:hypothetical protein